MGDIRGELYITTEGMLMYFTQNELETVFGNIRRLLSEFGGKWITMDSELDTAQKKIMSIITGSLPKDRADSLNELSADARQKALEVLGEVNFWVMTAKQKTREESAPNDIMC